jgi:rhodanese-related sulfurtransferase
VDPLPEDISVEELARRRREGDGPVVLDVRLPQELQIAALDGDVLHIPLHLLPVRMDELDRDREYAVLCHHGGRSWQAVRYLRSRGFLGPRNVDGGIDRWSALIDPEVPRY